MSPWEYTIAKLFSDAGYATALYGKWHLGDDEGRLPTDQGFDEWWGSKNSLGRGELHRVAAVQGERQETPMIWEGKKGEPSKPVMPLDLKVRPVVDEKYIIPKTVDFIKRNAAAKKPFFVYVGYSEMHPPAIANPDFAGKSVQRGGLYADLLAEMDYRVGQVLDAVKEAGVEDNTIFVLSSDNGRGRSDTASRRVHEWAISRQFHEHAVRGKHAGARNDPLAGKNPARVVTQEILAAWTGCPRSPE